MYDCAIIVKEILKSMKINYCTFLILVVCLAFGFSAPKNTNVFDDEQRGTEKRYTWANTEYAAMTEMKKLFPDQKDSLLALSIRKVRMKGTHSDHQIWMMEKQKLREVLTDEQLQTFYMYKYYPQERLKANQHIKEMKDIISMTSDTAAYKELFLWYNLMERSLREVFGPDSVKNHPVFKNLSSPRSYHLKKRARSDEKYRVLSAVKFFNSLLVSNKAELASDVRLIETVHAYRTIFSESSKRGEKADALRMLRDFAQGGFAPAMNTLGYVLFAMYSMEYVPIDPPGQDMETQCRMLMEAISWFKKGAQAGDPRALYNYQFMQRIIEPTPEVFANLHQMLKRNESTNLVNLWIALGMDNFQGWGCKQDYVEAVHFFQKAANAKSKPGQLLLGRCYLNGYGVPRDTLKGKRMIQAAGKVDWLLYSDILWHDRMENSLVPLRIQHGNLWDQEREDHSYLEVAHNNEDFFYGKYVGSVIHYDWSGRYIIEEIPVEIQIRHDGDSYLYWKQADYLAGMIHFTPSEKCFEFLHSSLMSMSQKDLMVYTPGWRNELIRSNFLSLRCCLREYKGKICLSGNLFLGDVWFSAPLRPVYLSLTRVE